MNSLQKFILNDPLLYSRYLIHCDSLGEYDIHSPQSFVIFMLWFVVTGRHEYSSPIVIPPEILFSLSRSDSHHCHPMMYYLANQENLHLSGEALRVWYYTVGVRKYSIGGFLNGEDLIQYILYRKQAGFLDDIALDGYASDAGKSARSRRISIIGFHRSVLGLGEDARCLFKACLQAGITPELVDVSPKALTASSDSEELACFESRSPTSDLLVYCLPASEMMVAISKLNIGGAGKRKDRYAVGYWPWETTELADYWQHVFNYVDEIWASSDFLVSVYRSRTDLPVIHMAPAVGMPRAEAPEKYAGVLDGSFNFLAVFDFYSRIERKNPAGTIEAFRRAFGGRKNVKLILKTINGRHNPVPYRNIVQAIGGDDRIVVIDDDLTRPELCWLIQAADVLVSLHRAEGFGRPIAEAMVLGTPVIATGWSGPVDFLNEETGFPVRYTLRPVAKGEYPFAAGQWAEPDLAHAAALMSDIFEGGADLPRIVDRARSTVRAKFDIAGMAIRLHDRLATIADVRAPLAPRQKVSPSLAVG